MWGEWIEIYADMAADFIRDASLPVWGEWIEIPVRCPEMGIRPGLSPCGESGLKCAQQIVDRGLGAVSPRVGRVD